MDHKQLIKDDQLNEQQLNTNDYVHTHPDNLSTSSSSSSSSSLKTTAKNAVKLLSLGNKLKINSNHQPNFLSTTSELPANLHPSEQWQLHSIDTSQTINSNQSTTSTTMEVDRYDQHSASSNQLQSQPQDRSGSRNGGSSIIGNDHWQSHCHLPKDAGNGKPGHPNKQQTANRRLLITTLLCFVFMILELVGGYLSNSLSIMTDAAHLFSDIASFGLSLLAVHLSARKSNRRYTFGYQRAEILGAVCSILLIWALTAAVVWFAVQRLITMDFEIESTVMMAVSLFGVAVNILMGITLHGCMCTGNAETNEDAEIGKVNCPGDNKNGSSKTITNGDSEHSKNSGSHSHKHSHSHSHSHSHGHSHGGHSHGLMEGESINIRAAFIHVLGDLIQSIGVFIAAVLIYFRPDWKVADPICTFLFSIVVMVTTVRIMRESLLILMEAAPPNMDYMTIKLDLLGLPGVQMVHSLRLWQLSVDQPQLSCHLVISDPASNGERLLQMARQMLRNKHDIRECTIQLEAYQPQVMLACENCNDV